MKSSDVTKLPSMPLASPSYPSAPFQFVNREYLIITYLSDPEAIRAALPEPLQPDGSNKVLYEFIKMPDSYGFGDYTESGIVIPCTFNNEPVNFTAQMYLDCEPPIAAGREIWGFPKKHGYPTLSVVHDTLTGTLTYAGQQVALGTMAYKHINLMPQGTDPQTIAKKLMKTQVNLKIIPAADGGTDVAQLVGYNLENVQVKGAWEGPARLHLIPHVNAPVADLPLREVLGGLHMIADLVLPHGRIIHDYLKG
jgi:acetoacetate decarboxylase